MSFIQFLSLEKKLDEIEKKVTTIGVKLEDATNKLLSLLECSSMEEAEEKLALLEEQATETKKRRKKALEELEKHWHEHFEFSPGKEED